MIDDKKRILIGKYGGSVPRYTSYPTAVQFQKGIEPQNLEIQLAAIENSETISLYIHIPFCHSLCHYCGCHTKITHKYDIISSYVDTLCKEVTLVASKIRAIPAVSRIHLGGGSPNYACTSDIAKILTTIKNSFFTTHNTQVDMECDPRLLNVNKIRELSSIGVRRISLGIQDFDERVQRAINRIQSFTEVQRHVEHLRDNHIADINFDLIVGLPEQTLQSIQETAKAVVILRPSRIAVFSYAHVPWMKKHQKLLEKYPFPSPETRYEMQNNISQILQSAGYQSIGIDHYALPKDSLFKAYKSGRLQRNFQGYTDDPATMILGFGLSAISQLKNSYIQNTLEGREYRASIESGHLPVSKGVQLTDQDIQARKAIMHIMCDLELDLEKFPNLKVRHDQLSLMAQDGLVVQKGQKIKITKAGKPFTRVVASCFDPYLENAADNTGKRHAKAI